MNCDQAKKFLSAHADDELDLVSSVEMEAHLASCPACAAEHRAQTALKQSLRGADLKFVPRPGFEARVLRAIREEAAPVHAPRTASWFSWLRLPVWVPTGLAALLAIGLFLAPWDRDGGQQELVDEAVANNVRSLMATHLFDVASSDHHTVKPWFAGKLDYSPPVPELAADGFPLAGGRLDVLGGRPVAALVYQRRKHIINLFVWPAAKAPLKAFTRSTEGYQIHGWTEKEMNYLAVSEINDEELSSFVDLIKHAP
jgi:anti-sigma factor RsiW